MHLLNMRVKNYKTLESTKHDCKCKPKKTRSMIMKKILKFQIKRIERPKEYPIACPSFNILSQRQVSRGS